MKVVPYLNFSDNANTALEFYADALSGSIQSKMLFGDQEMPGVTDENRHLIMHAELKFGDNLIYVSDSFEPGSLQLGNAYTVHLDCDSEEQIRTVFEKLAVGGKIISPLEDTFWNAIFGYLIDQFGVQWSFNYQKPEA